jgi:hypothetical protein
MSQHAACHFSITIAASDLAVVYCLRALSDYSQDTENSRITWGGTKDDEWQAGANASPFGSLGYRIETTFLATAGRLLPTGSWSEVSRSDADPARPQA